VPLLALLCLLGLCHGISASAQESYSNITRSNSKDQSVWIVEICTSPLDDAGTTGEFTVIPVTSNNKYDQGSMGMAEKWEDLRDGCAMYYSNNPSGKKNDYTYPYGSRVALEPGRKYYMAFTLDNKYPLENLYIQPDWTKKASDGYDNIRIAYVKTYRLASGTIGDLTPSPGGGFYRPFDGCTFDSVRYCDSCDAFNRLAQTSHPYAVTGTAITTNNRIPKDIFRIPLAAESTSISAPREYVLRLATKEGGTFTGNLRVHIYTQQHNISHEELAATIDIDQAALNQGKPLAAHDLTEYKVLDIPFHSECLSAAGRNYNTIIPTYYYTTQISKIIIEPLGNTGTGWLPASVAVLGGNTIDEYCRPQTLSSQNSAAAACITHSMENNYTFDSSVLAWWVNEDNVGFTSGTRTELRAAGAQIGRQLLRPKVPGLFKVDDPNYQCNPKVTCFYLGFQTKDLLESSMSLQYTGQSPVDLPDYLNSITWYNYSASQADPQMNSFYIDVTYRTNASAFYETSTYQNSPSMYSFWPAVNPDIRTMRFYLVEGAWAALIKRGVQNHRFAYESLFTHGQSDYVPICLLDMATGSVDDIINVTLGTTAMDKSLTLDSFAIYADEPDIGNLSSLNNIAKKDQVLAFHPDVTFKNYPLLYYAPPGGIPVIPGGRVSMETREGTQLVKPDTTLAGYFFDSSSHYHPFEPMINYGNTYLFTMRPSDLANTRTDSDLDITLSYLDNDNINQNISFRVNEMVRVFYGNSAGTYLPQNQSRVIQFLLDVNDVKTFLSVTVSLSDTGKQFQFEEVGIYRVNEADNQILYAFNNSEAADGEIGTLHYKDRYVDQGELIAKVSKTTYLAHSSTSRTLAFIDYSSGDAVDQTPSVDQGLTSIKSQMAYNEINKDLKLASVRSTYEIQVDVANIADAGSGNYFFFQMVFENGTSGVVLANDQIAGDAFRQGETSVFSIMTNQYYGQPKSMRIYTHSSNTDDTTSFDKLNIDKINIIRQSGIGLSTSWIIENVGWIDINYAEEDISGVATQMNASTDSAPNNTTICREYFVTKNSAAMDFMVEFKTAGNTEVTDPALTALVSYKKTTGANASVNVNVTEKADEFNGVNGAAYVAGDLTRFYISLNDVASINQITFESDKQNSFILQDLRIYRVSDRGEVYLDSTGRYNRDGELTPITYGAMDTPQNVRIGNPAIINLAANQNMNVSFSTSTDGTTSFTSGATVQTNVAEKLNIYIFPGDNTRFRYPVYGALKYTGTYQSGFMQKSLRFDPADNLPDGAMALRGVDISNLGSISSLTLSTDDSSGTSVSHVIIERLTTTGRKLKTYDINFGSTYLLSPVQAYVNTEEETADMKQTVTITTKQPDPLRLSKTNDIGVAIRYRSSIDSSVQYVSDYVYLSQQAKNSLSKGEPVTAALYERNVGEITAVSIITTGGITLSTDTIYACNYNKYDELLYATGIASPMTITPESGNINRADYHDTTLQKASTVMPVTFTFKTAEDKTKVPVAGTFSKVYGVLVCEDPNNSSRTVEINLGNLKDYFSKTELDAGEVFQAGKTDTFTAYLYNTGDPLELRLSMDPEDNDPWTLSEVSVRRKLPDGSYAAKNGVGDIVSADEALVIDLRTLSAEDQINAQQPAGGSGGVSGDTSGSGSIITGSGNSSGTPVPDQTPVPTETPVPDQTPEPTGTPVPDQTPEPTGTPVPDQTPEPTEVPEPDQTPETAEVLKPNRTPVPIEVPEPDNTGSGN